LIVFLLTTNQNTNEAGHTDNHARGEERYWAEGADALDYDSRLAADPNGMDGCLAA
jgi:hypothetical protein